MQAQFKDHTPVWIRTDVLESLREPSTPPRSSTLKRRIPTHSTIQKGGRGNGNNGSDSKDWGWVYGYILTTSTSTSTSTPASPSFRHRSSLNGNNNHNSNNNNNKNTTVQIADASSPYHDQTFTLPSSNYSSKSNTNTNTNPSFVMANAHDQPEHDSQLAPPHDLIHLTHLHEPAVISSLKQRYAKDEIYTSTGPILLALNPFKRCPHLYSNETMTIYSNSNSNLNHHDATLEEEKKEEHEDHNNNNNSNNKNNKPPPHVFAVADRAFRNMMDSTTQIPNQSILVSGESGAGKTVTTKFVMQYLANLSSGQNNQNDSKPKQKQKPKQNQKQKQKQIGMEQQVLQSNPILESFGNARTIRNDNSSRFGKFIEIHFHNNHNSSSSSSSSHSISTPTLMGASIKTYLLEKVRLITQTKGERNYHVFYEVLAGASSSQREQFFLYDLTAQDFNMTNSSGCYDRRDGITDKSTFDDLNQAMDTMGFSKEEQSNVLTIACALLHASNITFVESSHASADASQLDQENPFLSAAVTLLGVSVDDINIALCTCAIDVAGERLVKHLSLHQASKALEAFIKATYAALFRYIVHAINHSIAGNNLKNGEASSHYGASSSSSGSSAFIGVLDIFGFESFTTNSFEQLCINYCNEALQQQFNRFVFKLEQQEYEREGIKWSFIKFPDNQDVLDLIDKKHTGILSVLDEQCRLTKCTDQSFANVLYEKCSSHTRFEFTNTQRASGKFSVHHYAGPVEYTCQSFLEKNKDELPKEATELLQSSSNPFLPMLAQFLTSGSTSSSTSSQSTSRNLNISSESSVCSVNSNQSRNSRNSMRKSSSLSRASVGSQFSTQLRDLRERIDQTSPHYIRCLKPNDDLIPDHFDSLIIADQLRCAGVLEAVRVSRVGYPQRYTYPLFVQRYKILALQELKRIPAYQRGSTCEVLVHSVAKQICAVSPDMVEEEPKKKHSLTPYKSSGYNAAGKKDTSSALDLISVGIQIGKTKVFLRQHAFDAIEKLRSEKIQISCYILQATMRMFLARTKYQTILHATLRIQCCIRSYLSKTHAQKIRLFGAALILQCFWRRAHSIRYRNAACVIVSWTQRVFRGNKGRRKYRLLNNVRQTIRIQRCWRRHRAMLKLRKVGQSVIIIQCLLRQKLARCRWKELKKDAKSLDKIAQERDKLREEAKQMRKALEEAQRKAMEDSRNPMQIDRIDQNSIAKSISTVTNCSPSHSFLSEDVAALKEKIERLKHKLSLARQMTAAAAYREFPSNPTDQEKELLNLSELCSDKDREIAALKKEIQLMRGSHSHNNNNNIHRVSNESSHNEHESKQFMHRIFSNRQPSQDKDSDHEDGRASSLVSSIFTPQKVLSRLGNLNSFLGRTPAGIENGNASTRKDGNIRNSPFPQHNFYREEGLSDDMMDPSVSTSFPPSTLDSMGRNPVCPSVLSSSFVDDNGGNGTPLHDTIPTLNPAHLKEAIENSHDIHKDINTGDEQGKTPLHLAAIHGSPEMVSLLLNNFAVTNSQDHSGNTPLHYAEDASTIKALLEGGARPNIPNEHGLCALHLAVRRNDLSCVQILLEHGADVNVADNIRWYTPLHLIAQSSDAESPKDLDAAEDNVSSTDSNETKNSTMVISQIAECLCSTTSPSKPDLNSQDSDGNTPLHHAAILGTCNAMPLIQLFLKYGSHPNICNERGQTPLHLFCHNIPLRTWNGYQELLHLLLFSKSDPNKASLSGCTPLHLALFHRDIDAAVQLIHHGAQLHVFWAKPAHWETFWDEGGSTETLALDMVIDEHSMYRVLSSIRHQQAWAPSRLTCMQCKAVFGPLLRKHHCRHCARVICGQCSPGRIDSNLFPFTFDKSEVVGKGSVRVCIVCEEILQKRQDKYRDSFLSTP